MGLDGATFDVIDKFNQYELPCLKGLIANGVRASLESTFPPITGPAWTACATGKNPGKTGAFDFLNRTSEDTYQIKSLSSVEFRQARSFWDYLSDTGLKVGIWNYPCLYPAYPINGFMISGFGSSPDIEGISYPKDLMGKLVKLCGGYTISVPWSHPRYSDNPPLFFNDLMELLDQNEKALSFLLEKDPDIFFGVISATDFAQHYLWKFLDSSHTLYNEKEAKEYKPMFLKIWQRIDKILENAFAELPSKTNTIIMSDHGFGPHKQAFYVNSWLESESYLVREKGKRKLPLYLQSLASSLIKRMSYLSPKTAEVLKQRGSKYARPFLQQLDLSKTTAFANTHATNSGQIYINRPAGQSRVQIRGEIAEKLRKSCHKLNLNVNIYFPEEIYSGKFLRLAPDILFEINNFECSVHYQFNDYIYKSGPHLPTHSGSHRKNGIFIAHGPDVKQGVELKGISIYDMAPTILHMFGLPVPDDMDGRVLKEIFRGGSEPAQREVKYQHIDVEREKAKVKERIRKLRESRKL